MLPINDILDVIQQEIFSGCAFLSKIGLAFLLLFIALEFIKGGIDATSGRGFTLDKTLYLYLFLAVVYSLYPQLQAELKTYGYRFCEYIYKNFGHLNVSVTPTLKIFQYLWAAYLANPFKTLLLLPVTILGSVLIFILAVLVAILSMIATDIVVLTAFLGFEFTLACVPFFIPFFMSGEMNHIAKQWVNNILMYCVEFPLIALVLRLVERLNEEVVNEVFLEDFIGKNQILDIYVVIFIPLLGLGMIWQAVAISKMLFPPSGGFISSSSIGAPVVAATAYTVRTVTKAVGQAVSAAVKGAGV